MFGIDLNVPEAAKDSFRYNGLQPVFKIQIALDRHLFVSCMLMLDMESGEGTLANSKKKLYYPAF